MSDRNDKTMRKTSVPVIHVRARPQRRSQAWLVAGQRVVRAALGRSGIKAAGAKREGDGATPSGQFHPVRLWWRADRWPRPRTLLPVRGSGRTTPGVKTQPIGATTSRSKGRPVNQAI